MFNPSSHVIVSLCWPIFCFPLLAQEEPIPSAGAKTESNSIIVSATDDGQGMPNIQMMAFSNTDGDLALPPMLFSGDGGPSAFSGLHLGNDFALLNHPSVQKDLQLVDDQLKQIEDINSQFSKQIQEKLQGMKDGTGQMRFDDHLGLSEMIRELQRQQQEQISSILLPIQQDRLRQVGHQMKARNMGTAQVLVRHLDKELGITADQRKRIESKAEELNRQVNERIAQAKAEAKVELMKELTAEQREKLEKLMGDEFVTNEQDFEDMPRYKHFSRSQGKARDF